MNCTICHFESPLGMKFCGQCGNSVQITCIGCQFENPLNFNYCGNCGDQLSEAVSISEQTISSKRSTPDVVPVDK